MVDEDRIANQRFARCRSQLGSRKKNAQLSMEVGKVAQQA